MTNLLLRFLSEKNVIFVFKGFMTCKFRLFTVICCFSSLHPSFKRFTHYKSNIFVLLICESLVNPQFRQNHYNNVYK
jgi:hypothetical protein